MVHYTNMRIPFRRIDRRSPVLPVLLTFFAVAALRAPAQDLRDEPIRAIILMDRSQTMASGLEASAAWLNLSVVDAFLREGDYAVLWSFDREARLELETGSLDQAAIASLKTTITSVGSSETRAGLANYEAALNALKKTITDFSEKTPVSLIIMTTNFHLDPAEAFSSDSVLRELFEYSRLMDFPGWKAVFIAHGIADRVEEAVRQYEKIAF